VLFLQVLQGLAEFLRFVLGEDPERDVHFALHELHLEPVLAGLDAPGDVDLEASEAADLAGSSTWSRLGFGLSGSEKKPAGSGVLPALIASLPAGFT
jgi:hypothetical protein